MSRNTNQRNDRLRARLGAGLSLAAGVALISLLWSCSSTPPQIGGDGPPRGAVDLASVADAVPRHEPRSRYGNPESYEVFGRRYRVMRSASGYVERGIASWYGTKFHGRRTSSGEAYDMFAMTAAHKSLPIPSYVRVTNLANGRSTIVRVNDRGPFVKNRIIDLSYAAAHRLGVVGNGTAPVEVRAIDPDEYAPAPVQAVTPTTEEGSPRFFLQVGAFSELNNAERMRSNLLQLAIRSVEIHTESRHGGRLYKVRVGPYRDVSEADRAAQALSEAGHDETRVIID